MARWQERTVRATVVLLVASVLLIGPGLAGLGASAVLGVLLAGVGAALFVLRDRLVALVAPVDARLARYAGDLWLAALLGALVVVAMHGASPAELQALGGLAGLVGMANYFLRPVYFVGSSVLRRLGRLG